MRGLVGTKTGTDMYGFCGDCNCRPRIPQFEQVWRVPTSSMQSWVIVDDGAASSVW